MVYFFAPLNKCTWDCVARRSKTGREGGESGAKIVVYPSLRVADGGGSGDTVSDGKRYRNHMKRWGGDRYDIKLATDPRLGVIPDQGWNITTS